MVVETYPMDAPKSFEHILALVKKGFYNNQAVHRVVPGQAVQFGDPQSRNMMLVDWWGRGPNSGSGSMIGVSEVSKTRKHRRGTLAIANSGSPALGDSQVFIALRAVPAGAKCTIIGRSPRGWRWPTARPRRQDQVGHRHRRAVGCQAAGASLDSRRI
jgi:cyclophilin family peptidyl-prolyl cis-trans isomerase